MIENIKIYFEQLIQMNREIIKFNKLEKLLNEQSFNLLEIIIINKLFIFSIEKEDKMDFINEVRDINDRLKERLKRVNKMKNWEVLQKKINKMNKNEFIEFMGEIGAYNIHEIGKMCDVEQVCNEAVLCTYDNWKCNDCLKLLLNKEYQPPKQEKWIIHRTLRKKGIETYVSYKWIVDLGYYILNEDGKTLWGYEKLEDLAQKFTKEKAIEIRDTLNKYRKGKQYLWVISKVKN